MDVPMLYVATYTCLREGVFKDGSKLYVATSHGLRNEIVAELRAESERGKPPGSRESPQPSRERQKHMEKKRAVDERNRSKKA